MGERRRLMAFMAEWRQRDEEFAQALERLRAERDEAIRRAHQGGMTMEQIAAVVGLSQQRISQIIRGTS